MKQMHISMHTKILCHAHTHTYTDLPVACLDPHIWCQNSLSPASWDGGRWCQTDTVPLHPAVIEEKKKHKFSKHAHNNKSLKKYLNMWPRKVSTIEKVLSWVQTWEMISASRMCFSLFFLNPARDISLSSNINTKPEPSEVSGINPVHS